jgi:hypothetical protein
MSQFPFIREHFFSTRSEILSYSCPQSRAGQNQSATKRDRVSHEIGNLLASARPVQLISQGKGLALYEASPRSSKTRTFPISSASAHLSLGKIYST